jgi:hypothetical protein
MKIRIGDRLKFNRKIYIVCRVTRDKAWINVINGVRQDMEAYFSLNEIGAPNSRRHVTLVERPSLPEELFTL